VNIIPYNYRITATVCMIVICYTRRVGGIRVQTASNFYRRGVSGIQGTDSFKFL